MRLPEKAYLRGFPVRMPDGSIHLMDLSLEDSALKKLDPVSKARALRELFSHHDVTPLSQAESKENNLRIVRERRKRPRRQRKSQYREID